MHRRVPMPGHSFLHISCASVVIIQDESVKLDLGHRERKSQICVIPVFKHRGYTGDTYLHGGLLDISKNSTIKKRRWPNMSSTQNPPCVCKVNDYFNNFFVNKVDYIIKCMCTEKKLQKVQRWPRDHGQPNHSHESVSCCSCWFQKDHKRSLKLTIEFVDC